MNFVLTSLHTLRNSNVFPAPFLLKPDFSYTLYINGPLELFSAATTKACHWPPS
jgi:hypothetical protein